MSMTLRVSAIVTMAAWGLMGAPIAAQLPTPKIFPAAKVDVVLERYQGDKKVASMPFSLWVTGGSGTPGMPGYNPSRGSVRIGVDVPIGSSTETRATNTGNVQTGTTTTTTPQYRNVGTSIDCSLAVIDDGKYSLEVRLDDRSIFDPASLRNAGVAGRGSVPPPSGPMSASAFRTFSFDNSLPMRDGQTAEYVNATDKVTGEVVKAIVTLTIAK